jgi:GNAT superfamily N-acetyltransferase
MAGVWNAESPAWPTTPEALAVQDARRDPALHRAVFVAEHDTRMVGWATVGHDPIAHREGKFLLDIRVPPAVQGQGIGSALYQSLTTHLQPFRPRELQTAVWETLEHAIRFVTRRGFVEAWRRIDSRLDVSRVDFARYAGLEARVRALGVAIHSYASLAHDPDRIQKLYLLDRATWEDVPYGEPVRFRSLKQFCAEELDTPDFLPQACFVAVKDGRFVGYSYLTGYRDHFVNEMTGVLRDYRRQGLATLLKLHAIQYAQAHGGCEIRTTNDSVNTRMLALNARLGFTRDGATIRFIKRLE